MFMSSNCMIGPVMNLRRLVHTMILVIYLLTRRLADGARIGKTGTKKYDCDAMLIVTFN
jgi:hypothetical protein